MSDNLGTMGETAKALSRNPLGIIALFIVLVYAMAALVLGVAANGLGAFERVLLVLFLIGFPPGVLWVFRDLVMNHTGKLYSPADFKEEKNFMEVVAALAAAAGRAEAAPGQAPAAPADPIRLFTAARMATAATRSATRTPKVLWVDDNPANNVHERRALEAAGMAVQTALSTEDALARCGSERFDVIVSDLRRGGAAEAGYDLLKALRARGDATPFVIYAGPATAAQRDEAKSLGALGRATSAGELLELVTKALPG
jgi:CheY-like chemotaxis protein